MMISKIDAVSFAARPSKNVEEITSKVFKKLYSVRDNKLGTYLGTTPNGDNVTIRETKLGKSADLYVSYADKKNTGKNIFGVYHVNKSSNVAANILSDDGKKVSRSEAKQIERIIDALV